MAISFVLKYTFYEILKSFTCHLFSEQVHTYWFHLKTWWSFFSSFISYDKAINVARERMGELKKMKIDTHILSQSIVVYGQTIKQWTNGKYTHTQSFHVSFSNITGYSMKSIFPFFLLLVFFLFLTFEQNALKLIKFFFKWILCMNILSVILCHLNDT